VTSVTNAIHHFLAAHRADEKRSLDDLHQATEIVALADLLSAQ
jgi:hypothetical protein